ncbi:MAG: hypothetical protein DRP55_04105 [Spirochaetes bacterium]|nr:hypothetical protein [Deltaproteobacteria bacterium]RKY01548.1 MAG: hypothetical protein DRP55_04105 [Spirochaetota bacterium]RLA91827.1 MAG: hypothetical protein DRG20_00160 [Deltaproteobacteria bacterium]
MKKNKILKEYLKNITIGKRKQCKNLTIFPILYSSYNLSDYITLDEALNNELIEIEEIDESGIVSEINVTNKSQKNLLLFFGEELIGAKQNRIINITMLIGKQKAVRIPVSCVEAGRWESRSRKFGSDEILSPVFMRAKGIDELKRSAFKDRRYHLNQGRVWEDVDETLYSLDAYSFTSDLTEAYKKKELDFDYCLEALPYERGEAGAIFFINGILYGFEIFGNANIMKKIYDKLLKSYLIDASTYEEDEMNKDVIDLNIIYNLIDDVADSDIESYKGIDLGENIFIKGKIVKGLGFIYDDHILHLSSFPKEMKEEKNLKSRFASQRKRRNLF